MKNFNDSFQPILVEKLYAEENKKEDENEIEEEDRQLVVEENSDEEADVEPQQVISRNQVYGSL